MSEAPTLSRFVSLRSRFVRSVHVERDFGTAAGASGYLLTECGAGALQAVKEGLASPAQRALSVLGPYGAGKSAFCVDLARQLSDAGVDGVRLHPVLVVGSRRPLGAALVDGLRASLEGLGRQGAGLRRVLGALPEAPGPRAVADVFAVVSGAVKAAGIADGLLVVVDELGKFLEYAALHAGQGDVFALQELAEAAARSPQENPLLVLTVLHQSAEAYARTLGPTQQAEWAKVGERFRALPFLPSDRERLDVIGRALDQDAKLGALPGLLDLARTCAAHGLTPAGMGEGFPALAQASYPLHPVALLALPGLFRRAGQSHRSVFNFLAGEEPSALGRFLKETPFDPVVPPLYGLDRLYDYATEALAGTWAGASAALWAEVSEAVERTEGLSATAHQMLKCIGLLTLLKSPRLPASQTVLELALAGIGGGAGPDVEAALAELVGRRLVVHSRSRGTYRLFEGGDVDVAAEMERAASGLGRDVSLQTARELCPPPVLIARRHSFETGTLRVVSSEPCAAGALGGLLSAGVKQLRLALSLAQTEEESEAARAAALVYAGPETLIAVALESEALHQAGRDVAAAAQVEKDTPELENERASRRELSGRRHEAEAAFRAEWLRLFSPGPEGARWYWRGEVCEITDRRGLSAQLSAMADATFAAAPRLRNELINRPSLSSAAAAGRRSLIEAMLTRGGVERMGMTGFPPEVSMYECLLGATELHRQTEAGGWEFGAPRVAEARLGPVWEAFSEIIFANPPEPRSVQAVWDVLKAPPYGLTEGVLPVLLCAFLRAHESETTLYREGTFLPEPGIADWELLLRRPEMFAVAGCRVTGARALVVTRIARGLNVTPAVVPVARALIRSVRSLPEQAWKTRRLPAPVLAVRDAFEKVRSPERLLFVDLPAALGVSPPDGDAATDADIETFFAALNGTLRQWQDALPRLLVQARADLLASCGLPASDAGWAGLRERCVLLDGRVAHPLLLPFVRHLATEDGAAALERVLALLCDRAPRTWSDLDYERFLSQSRAVGALLREADAQETLTPAPVLSVQEMAQTRTLADTIRIRYGGTNRRLLRAALLALLQDLNTTEEGTAHD